MSEAREAAAPPLAGKVCVVAGASRGVGRGIALGLAEAGATVVCSGRSTRFGHRTEARGETVEDSAEAVEEAGGRGHPYVCDHTDPRALHDLSAWVLRGWARPTSLHARCGAAMRALTAIPTPTARATAHRSGSVPSRPSTWR